MKKIIITGCAGFIGFNLSENLLKNKNVEIIGIDNLNAYYSPTLKKNRLNILLEKKNFSFVEKDISKIETIDVSDSELLIHLAAQPGVRIRKEFKRFYHATNVAGFKNICAFAKRSGISKIIYASSSSVYGDQDLEKFNENLWPLEPKSIYGKTKLSNELYARDFGISNKISMIGLRFFSVYGPYGRPDMAYFIFCDSIKKSKKITLFNNGDMARDMTYIDDLIMGIKGAIKQVMSSKEDIQEIYNLGNDYPVKTKEVLSIIQELVGKSTKIEYQNSENESIYTHADITKAKRALKYNPITDIKTGLKKFVKWYENYYE